MTEMHDVVEMLLNRIKDYPEDFVCEPSSQYGTFSDDRPWNKWQEALQTVYQVATQGEKDAINAAQAEAKRAIYMGAALKTIMSEEVQEDDEVGLRQSYYNTVQGMQGPTAMVNTMPISSTDKYIALMEQKQKEAEVQMRQQSLISQYRSGYQDAINNA